jgi:hypothetical protein
MPETGKLSVELNAANKAPPIPPLAPKTTATPVFGNEPRSTEGVVMSDVCDASVTAFGFRALRSHKRLCHRR